MVTVARTVGSVGATALALALSSVPLLVVALATYWVGDILDGWLARRLDQETRIGAVADIVCDRLCAGSFYIGLVALGVAPALPVATYLVVFVVIDLVLSLSFLAWPLMSPNYFYLVDRSTWMANWSPAAKALNSGAFLILLLLTGPAWATACAVLLLVGKSASLLVVLRLDRPEERGHPGAVAARPSRPAPTIRRTVPRQSEAG